MPSLICKSAGMLEAARRMERATATDSPVLIWGEKGTGKKTIAEMIHRRSQRAHCPLITVHTVDRGETRLNNGRFRSSSQLGDLAAAAGGTLLIDEIAGLSRTEQARLLALAERHQTSGAPRLGDAVSDFRLMATTRHELSQSIGQGMVREDLFYRLTVISIRLPALRHRKDDIPDLVYDVLAERCAAYGKPVPSVEPDLMQSLLHHPWPGNVGQLRATLDTMVAAEDTPVLKLNHLCELLPEVEDNLSGSHTSNRLATLSELERAAVMRALKVHQGNRTRAAKSLNISVRTLQRKLKNWGI
ncbi:MAG: sigma 54-interacting transcriptional regulator [Planctomycetota bacterium]